MCLSPRSAGVSRRAERWLSTRSGDKRRTDSHFLGWKCCKPRVLTFDEFLAIKPCTTGKHSTVDDTPQPESIPAPTAESLQDIPTRKPVATMLNSIGLSPPSRESLAQAAAPTPTRSPAPAPEDESDDPSAIIPTGATCKRRSCNKTYDPSSPREDEECVHHPGQALFHEGSKGWTCCKRRVLEFDEFMKIKGCKTKKRHLFVGKGKPGGEEKLETVR